MQKNDSENNDLLKTIAIPVIVAILSAGATSYVTVQQLDIIISTHIEHDKEETLRITQRIKDLQLEIREIQRELWTKNGSAESGPDFLKKDFHPTGARKPAPPPPPKSRLKFVIDQRPSIRVRTTSEIKQ